MLKPVLMIFIVVCALSLSGYASEEEEAQTMPRPLMQNKMVSKENHELKARVDAQANRERLFEELEEAQPGVTDSRTSTGLKGKPLVSNVPDEEEEETGMVAPASTF